MKKSMKEWEALFIKKMREVTEGVEPAHDFSHFSRVVKIAKKICEEERADPNIVIPAAWLHDIVIIPKTDPRRSQASQIAADTAIQFLREVSYPEEYFNAISHAIQAHSFSANIKAESLEAQVVQDADRLDGLGAIGIARLFTIAGEMKNTFYSVDDPFCEMRLPNDKTYAVDHFYQKLFKTAETMQTESGRREAHRRVTVMQNYLRDLRNEIV